MMRSNRRGMSLTEAMVSITILLVMSTMVWTSMATSIEFNEVLSMKDETTRSARVTMSKLRRELQLAYLTTHKNRTETIQTVFTGLDEDPDSLYFASLAHQRLYVDSRESDQTEITVWAERAPREKGRGYVLYHRESARVDEEPDEGGTIYPLAYNVRSFNLRYFNPQSQTWQDEWDSRSADTPYVIPRAVEIGLVLIGPDPEDPERTVDIPFLSRVNLVFGPPLTLFKDPNLGTSASGAGGATGSQGEQLNGWTANWHSGPMPGNSVGVGSSSSRGTGATGARGGRGGRGGQTNRGGANSQWNPNSSSAPRPKVPGVNFGGR